jgi:hypothetical protein
MSTLTWDPQDLQECRVARRVYQRLRNEGYQCHQGGKPVKVFESERGEVTFEKPLNRYALLLENLDEDDRFDP